MRCVAFRRGLNETPLVEYDGKNITWGGEYWVVDEDVESADAAGVKYSQTDREEWQCYRYSKSCAIEFYSGGV